MLSISDQSPNPSSRVALARQQSYGWSFRGLPSVPLGELEKKGWNSEKIVILWVLYGFVLNKW